MNTSSFDLKELQNWVQRELESEDRKVGRLFQKHGVDPDALLNVDVTEEAESYFYEEVDMALPLPTVPSEDLETVHHTHGCTIVITATRLKV